MGCDTVRCWSATLFALGALAAPGVPASAARPTDPAVPILDDLDRARTLAPPPGGLSGVIEAPADRPEPTPAAREVAAVVAHARWATMPGAILELIFSEHQPIVSASLGVAYEWGDLDSAMWSVELDWTTLVPEAGNWLEVSTPPPGASYAESGLHLLSIDATYRRQFRLTEGFRALVGGGLGLGVLLGDFEIAEVLPTCEAPVSQCPHWPAATNEDADLPTRIIPVLHVLLGLEVDLGQGFSLRAQGGFRNLFYAGLSVGKTL